MREAAERRVRRERLLRAAATSARSRSPRRSTTSSRSCSSTRATRSCPTSGSRRSRTSRRARRSSSTPATARVREHYKQRDARASRRARETLFNKLGARLASRCGPIERFVDARCATSSRGARGGSGGEARGAASLPRAPAALASALAATPRARRRRCAATPAPPSARRACTSTLRRARPRGRARPDWSRTFPTRGDERLRAGRSRSSSTHGKGETVLPEGFQLQAASDAAQGARDGGLRRSRTRTAAPAPTIDGSSRERHGVDDARRSRSSRCRRSRGATRCVLPPLPDRRRARERRGRHALHAAARDRRRGSDRERRPTRRPKPNPPPRAQREEWALAEQRADRRRRSASRSRCSRALARRAAGCERPKPVPPPPPPRPPWEVALEELDEVRHAGLLERQRFAEYFDRVSDAVREYLGARFGFDGLESTTRRDASRCSSACARRCAELATIAAFLEDCDLVKFARVHADDEECVEALAPRRAHRARDDAPRCRALAPGPRADAPPPARGGVAVTPAPPRRALALARDVVVVARARRSRLPAGSRAATAWLGVDAGRTRWLLARARRSVPARRGGGARSAQDARMPRLRIGTIAPLARRARAARARTCATCPACSARSRSCLLVLALGAPGERAARPADATSEGIDIVLVLDLSGSMRAVLDADPKDLPGSPQIPRGQAADAPRRREGRRPRLHRPAQDRPHRRRRLRQVGVRPLAADARLPPAHAARLAR